MKFGPMKILVIHKVPPFNRGGAEQIIWRTAKRLAEEGHEIVFYSPTGSMDRDPPDISGIKFHWLSTSNTETRSQYEFFIKGASDYLSAFQSINPDLVYDNICPFPFHVAHFYGEVDVISKVHAIYRLDAITCKHHWPVKIGTILGEETYRLFSDELFVTNSKSTQERLSNIVDTDDNQIISNPIGIEPDDFNFCPDMGSDIVLSLSKLSPRKDIGTLLKAWKQVENEHSSAQLIIAGSGPLESELKSLAHELNLRRVNFEGFVSESRKHELLEKALIYTLPTLYEGFGISNLEAMASGCAVVSTNTWGVKDYLADGCNGIVIDKKSPNKLAKGILRLLNDRRLVKRLMRNGRETANLYTIQDSLDREVSIINRHVDSR